jgi:hypothetical protein
MERDRIEPVEDSHAGASAESQSIEPFPEASQSDSPQRPALATLRPRGNSNRARRPSIRLSRLGSFSSLDTLNLQQPDQQPERSISRQPAVHSPVAEEDESVHGRRRSSSEPRLGRWSSPPNTLPQVATPSRMMPLSEESSHHHQSPMPMNPVEGVDQQHAPEHIEPPPAALGPPGSRNVLRRTSQAALNRFSRNRASTVSGGPPTLASQEEQRRSEYAPQVVDVLDVIGKPRFDNAVTRDTYTLIYTRS